MSKPKQDRKSDDQEPRKPGRPEQRTRIPLDFEEALRDLMATGPPEPESPKKPGDKNPGT